MNRGVSFVAFGLSLTLLRACSDETTGRDPPLPDPTNEAPVALPGTAAAVEDGGPVSAAVPDATDADGNLNAAGYSLVTDVTEGSLAFASDGRFTFDPGVGFQDLGEGTTRAVSFEYSASDTEGVVSTPATITITVTGVNDAPTLASALTDQSTATGAVFSFTVPAGTFNDADADDTSTLTAAGLRGWLSFDGGAAQLTGTAGAADLGDQEITITVTDGSGASASDAFVIHVRSSPGGETYGYDDAGRLLNVTYENGAVLSYTYDMAGNVLARTVTP